MGSKDERRELGQKAVAMTQGNDYGQLDKGGHCKKEKSYGFSKYFKYRLYY